MDLNFWKNKKILITGHTGFKGSWLSLWLQSLNAKVIGVALDPPTQPNLFSVAAVAQNMVSLIGNVCDYEFIKTVQIQYQPEIVFHLAAQSLVRTSYLNPVETYATNVMGTVNLLESVRQHGNSVKAVIIITSDKCYENRESYWSYREHDPLGGHDPYSNSKACAELVSSAFRQSYSIPVATVRAGNVFGGGDWAHDRLIPDIIHSLTSQNELVLRYPHALRPWQHVLEPLHGYLKLAQKMFEFPEKYTEAWNFGPDERDVKSVVWIVNKILQITGKSLPCQISQNNPFHEASSLNLDSTKSKVKLGWRPRWDIETGLKNTIQWYQSHQAGYNMHETTLSQIELFNALSLSIDPTVEELANAIN